MSPTTRRVLQSVLYEVIAIAVARQNGTARHPPATRAWTFLRHWSAATAVAGAALICAHPGTAAPLRMEHTVPPAAASVAAGDAWAARARSGRPDVLLAATALQAPFSGPEDSAGIRWSLSEELMEALNEPAPGRSASISAECLEGGGVRRQLVVRQVGEQDPERIASHEPDTVSVTELPDGRVLTSRSRAPLLQRAPDGQAPVEQPDRRGDLASLYPQVFHIDCAALPAGRRRGLADSVRSVLRIEPEGWPGLPSALPPTVDLRAYGLGRATLRVQRAETHLRLVVDWVDASDQAPDRKLARLQQASENITAIFSGHADAERFLTGHHDGELSESASYRLAHSGASVQWSFGPRQATLSIVWIVPTADTWTSGVR